MSLVKVSYEFDVARLGDMSNRLSAAHEAVREVRDSMRPVREAMGLSRVQLAPFIGMSDNQIGAAEMGNRTLSISEAVTILNWMIAVANGETPVPLDEVEAPPAPVEFEAELEDLNFIEAVPAPVEEMSLDG